MTTLAAARRNVIGPISPPLWMLNRPSVGLNKVESGTWLQIILLCLNITAAKNYHWFNIHVGYSFNTILLGFWYALNFIFLFTLGGTTIILLGNTAVNIALYDTYYAACH